MKDHGGWEQRRGHVKCDEVMKLSQGVGKVTTDGISCPVSSPHEVALVRHLNIRLKTGGEMKEEPSLQATGNRRLNNTYTL